MMFPGASGTPAPGSGAALRIADHTEFHSASFQTIFVSVSLALLGSAVEEI